MRTLALALLAALLLAGCASASAETRRASGVLLQVQSSSLTRVDTLRLRSDDGQELTFLGSPELERDPEGSPGHLRQHLARVDHVTVVYRETPEGLVALKVEHP